MTLPEMAGGTPAAGKKIRTLRPMLNEAIQSGQVHAHQPEKPDTVYRLVKNLGPALESFSPIAHSFVVLASASLPCCCGDENSL